MKLFTTSTLSLLFLPAFVLANGTLRGGSHHQQNRAQRQLSEEEEPSSSFKYGFDMSGPDAIHDTFPEAGKVIFLDPTKISNNTMSLAVLHLSPGAVRELHWHPFAAEWGFVTEGTCRITLMNNDNQYDNLEVGVGDIWFFPQSWGHAIQGVDEVIGCKAVLFLNSPMLPTYNDLSISEILSAFPTEAVSDNTNTPEEVVKTFHQGAIVINKGYMPPGPFPKSTNPLPESPIINILNGTCSSFGSGGYMYDIKNDIFPATTAMSGALVHLDAGTLHDIHWHPNADEMHYVLKGSLKVSVYGIGGAKDTFYLNKGDVGFIPKGFAHYFEAMEEETDILLTFNSPNWQTQELSSWLAVVPLYLTAISLNVSMEAIDGFPKTAEDFIGGSKIDGCPLSPSLPNCYGC